MAEGRAPRELLTSGTSMLPLIRAGSRALVRPLDPEEIRPGDVVAFREEGGARRTLLHRVLARRRSDGALLFREKGDHVPFSTWIGADRVEGLLEAVVRDERERLFGGRSRCAPARLLTFLFLLEARLFESARAAARRFLPGAPGARRAGLRAARLLLLPLRLPFLPLLVWAHPSRPRPVSLATRSFLVACVDRLGEKSGPSPAPAPRWEELPAEAARLGVAALVSEVLAGESATPAPTGTAAALRAAARRQALLHLEAVRSLKAAHAALSGGGLPYAALKGPVLSAAHYPAGAPRLSTDVDLLVPAAGLERAAGLLAEAGFRPPGGDGGLAARPWHFHATLRPPEPGMRHLELHWALVDRVNLFRIDERPLLERLRTVMVDGCPVTTLSREDELVYLALHAAKHGLLNRRGLADGRPPEWFLLPLTGNRLLWLADIHLALRHGDGGIDWDIVRERASAWNVMEPVGEILSLLERLWPGAAAGEALRALGLTPLSASGGRKDPLLRLLENRTGAALWAWSLEAGEKTGFRPARLLSLPRLLFPGKGRREGFSAAEGGRGGPLGYLAAVTRRLAGRGPLRRR